MGIVKRGGIKPDHGNKTKPACNQEKKTKERDYLQVKCNQIDSSLHTGIVRRGVTAALRNRWAPDTSIIILK